MEEHRDGHAWKIGKEYIMFRLVPFADKTPGEDGLCDYLSRIASNTILEGMELCFGILANTGEIPEKDTFEDICEEFCAYDFFRGVSEYFIPPSGSGRMKDEEVGKGIIQRKIVRMWEKLSDEKEFYTFDLLEERLFAELIRSAKDLFQDGILTVEEEKERESEVILHSKYELSSVCARKMARQIHRLSEMGIEDEAWQTEFEDLTDEECEEIYGDLFFWDDDYIIFWQDGFLKGIEMIQSFAGEQAGYGYDYACDIFTDIDFNPPMRLVGTQEANRIRNEQEEELYRKAMEEMAAQFSFSGSDDFEFPDDEDLPFS